jgi:predicted MFS family arabinose efflux permease
LGPLLLPVATTVPSLLWPLLFVWGGTMYGFYTQGIALLGDSYAVRDLPAANSLFVIVYSAGGIVGPAIGGFAMDLWRPNGFVLLLSAAALLLLAGLGLEARWRARG